VSEYWKAPHFAAAEMDVTTCVVSTPNKPQLRVQLGVDSMRAINAALDGIPTDANLLAASGLSAGEWRELSRQLESHGFLIATDQPAGAGLANDGRAWRRYDLSEAALQRRSSHTLFVVGESPLARLLTKALHQVGMHSTAVPELDDLPSPAPDAAVCIVMSEPAAARTQAVNAAMAERGQPWISIRAIEDRIYAGPVIRPGIGADMSDVLRRRLAAARSTGLWTSRFGADASPGEPWLRPSELRWAASSLTVQLERWLLGEPDSLLAATEIVLKPVAQEIDHHSVLAMPDRENVARPSRTTSRWHLLDAETGIVRSVKHPPVPAELPQNFHVAVAHASDMRRVAPFPNDRVGFGTSWESDSEAVGPAIGEVLERYCANWPASVARDDTNWDELAVEGVRATRPQDLVGYSDDQLREPGFPFERFDSQTRVCWTPGVEIRSGESVLVPSCWVYVSWNEARKDREPRLIYPNLAGISAGESREQAVKASLLENIERDAAMIWWAHAPQLPRLALRECAPDLALHVDEDRWEVNVIDISERFGIHVAAGCVRDRASGLFVVGFAARESFQHAARKALAEAFSLQWTGRTMSRAADSAAAADALANLKNLKPHRNDNRYLDSYRKDFRDVKDLACQLQLYLDPRAGEVAHDLVLGGEQTRLGDRRQVVTMDSVAIAQAIASETGHQPIVVDLTTADVREAGYHAVRVITPGLVPNYPAAFPQLGLNRVLEGASHFHWAAHRKTSVSMLNAFPLAHY
jgi:ribosomal protein S12 methylthiotransferase accessory factor